MTKLVENYVALPTVVRAFATGTIMAGMRPAAGGASRRRRTTGRPGIRSADAINMLMRVLDSEENTCAK